MARRKKKKGLPVNGILLLNKPAGISSNHALQQVKHLFQAQKAGHTGSLDPLASGMLPICFGEATKFSSFLLNADKRYTTTATLGITTTTGDSEGEILKRETPPALEKELIEATLNKFRGSIEQVPPMFSALKHQGKPLYELARQGIEIKRKSRKVNIHQLTLITHTNSTLKLEVECSKGTYIRTLVEDIGQELGCGAHVSCLHRNQVSPFAKQTMHTLESLQHMDQAHRDNLLLPIDAGLQELPQIVLNNNQCKDLFYGRPIAIKLPTTAFIRIYNQQHQFLGVGITNDNQKLQPKRLISESINVTA